MHTPTPTLDTYCVALGLRLTTKHVRGPKIPPGGPAQVWTDSAHEWRVTIRRARAVVWTGPYYTGVALTGPPSLCDVLHSLLMDASALGQTHADWCAESGYDPDSLRGLDAYQACLKTGTALRAAFTPEELHQLRQGAQEY